VVDVSGGGDDGWAELLDEARQELTRQEEENPNADLGEDMTPAEDSYVQGRWRGLGEMQTKEGKRTVALVWRAGDNAPGFLYGHAQLLAQVDELQPELGDEVLALRGPTQYYEKQGEERKTYPYALRKRPCADPLPGTSGGESDEPAAIGEPEPEDFAGEIF
jgi:hypothetical protein